MSENHNHNNSKSILTEDKSLELLSDKEILVILFNIFYPTTNKPNNKYNDN